MKKIKGPFIITKRLIMRQLMKGDTVSYHEIMGNEEVVKWLGSSKGKTFNETNLLIEKYNTHWQKNGYGIWGVIDRWSNELLGHCGLNSLKDTGEVELKYAFDPKSWGYGYSTESAKASIKFAFEKVKLKRIIALAKPNNIRSINVIKKNHFKFVGKKTYFGMRLMCYEIVDSH